MTSVHPQTAEMLQAIATADKIMADGLFTAARALREGCDPLEVADSLEGLGEGCMRSVARLTEFTS